MSLHDIFKYDDKRSITNLALDLLHDPPTGHTKIAFMTLVVQSELMNLPLPRPIRWLFKLTPDSFRRSFVASMIKSLDQDGYLTQMVNDTIRHMSLGTDKTDDKSAGGWGEVEFAKFLLILDLIGYKPSEHIVRKLQSNQSILPT